MARAELDLVSFIRMVGVRVLFVAYEEREPAASPGVP
jgi:hypothetical protein